mmetsp:Transcript_24611/g.55141  ORF Transcript_24611/g.55141 Transcript_24611/m.55141 type:complete len:313 (+) Transcript_24611:74-1012(+)
MGKFTKFVVISLLCGASAFQIGKRQLSASCRRSVTSHHQQSVTLSMQPTDYEISAALVSPTISWLPSFYQGIFDSVVSVAAVSAILYYLSSVLFVEGDAKLKLKSKNTKAQDGQSPAPPASNNLKPKQPKAPKSSPKAPKPFVADEARESLEKAFASSVEESQPESLPDNAEERPNYEEELMGKTVVHLKQLLREAGLKVGGTKAELVERLLESRADVATGSVFEAALVANAAHNKLVTNAANELSNLDESGEEDGVLEQEIEGATNGDSMPQHMREDLQSLTVVELKQMLKESGEKVSGKKAELIDRLLAL